MKTLPKAIQDRYLELVNPEAARLLKARAAARGEILEMRENAPGRGAP